MKNDLILLIRELGGKGSDTVLDFYLQKAYNSIKYHLNYTDDDMHDKFDVEIVSLALFYMNKGKSEGVVQMSQGSRSVTYEKIPQSILKSLPSPRLKVLG